jgi:hypothetical protein
VAVPTITTITPATGLTRGGQWIAIEGTGFQLPTVPPSGSGYLGAGVLPSVKVTIGGVDCEYAESASDTLAYCLVPRWAGSPSVSFPVTVDVRLANLATDGIEIPGEAVTEVDGFAYHRPGLVSDCYLKRIVDELITLLRRHVLPNVAVTISREWDDDPATVERLRDSAPSIHLIGPRTTINRFDSLNREDPEAETGDQTYYQRRRVPVTADLEFEVRIFAANPFHATNLVQAFLLTWRDITRIAILRDPATPALGEHSYEVEIPWDRFPDMDAAPNYSDLITTTTGLMIRGVHLDDESGTMIERGMTIWANDGEPVVELESV